MYFFLRRYFFFLLNGGGEGERTLHITTRIVAGDVSPLCYMVVWTSIWAESGA